MRVHGPVQFVTTRIPHKDGRREIDGHYLVVTDLAEEVGMMSTVLQVTDEIGRGFEVSQSLDGTEILVTATHPDGPRPQPRTPDIQRFPATPQSVGVVGIFRQTHVVMDIAWAPDRTFTVVPKGPYAADLLALGNIVCVNPDCGARIRVGRATKSDKACRCGWTFPELRLPFILPSAPTT